MEHMNSEQMGRLIRLTPADVRSVYSGKVGHCYCGCAGIHRYNSQHVEVAEKNRGYAIERHEINDAFVKKVLKIVQDGIGDDAYEHDNIFTLHIGQRAYSVYTLLAP